MFIQGSLFSDQCLVIIYQINQCQMVLPFECLGDQDHLQGHQVGSRYGWSSLSWRLFVFEVSRVHWGQPYYDDVFTECWGDHHVIDVQAVRLDSTRNRLLAGALASELGPKRQNDVLSWYPARRTNVCWAPFARIALDTLHANVLSLSLHWNYTDQKFLTKQNMHDDKTIITAWKS